MGGSKFRGGLASGHVLDTVPTVYLQSTRGARLLPAGLWVHLLHGERAGTKGSKPGDGNKSPLEWEANPTEYLTWVVGSGRVRVLQAQLG